jgi:5'-nucleotidase
MTTAPIALFDLDMTLADYEGRLKVDLARLASPGDPPIGPIHGDVPPHIEARRYAITAQPGWWLGLDRYQPGWDILEAAVNLGFRIQVLTKGPSCNPAAWGEKVQWFDRHLKDLAEGITLTTDKAGVYGRVLVEDWPAYAKGWLEFRSRGLVVLPAHAHNEGFTHPNAIRYDGLNLDAVKARLLAALGAADNK